MGNLSGIETFVQVAESLSFTDAGRVLEMSSSGIGKSIARLEKRLRVKLLNRTTRSVSLTAEGELYLDRCKRILAELAAAEDELTSHADSPSGRLRISVPLINALIMPALKAFHDAYPNIELDVDLSDHIVDIAEEGYDAVIRTGAPQDSRLASRQLSSFNLQLVASPKYLEREGTPTHPEHLAIHKCLHYKFPATGKIETWPLHHTGEQILSDLSRVVTCTTVDALLYLACEGSGIACLPNFATQAAIRENKLVVVLDEFTHHEGELWLLWPMSRYGSQKSRAFLDFFKNYFAKNIRR